MLNKLREIKTGLDKIRTWWKDREIAEAIAETIRQHSKKVEKAAEIYGEHFPHLDQKKMIAMAKRHDVAEYKEKDYTPWEISKEEKHRREKVVVMELQKYFWKKSDLLSIRMEMEEGKTEEAQIVKQLDQIDPAIQALEYEKLGYTNVTNFYPYALAKLTDPVLIKILNILLKKEYPHINVYEQYFTLLACNGDEEAFKEKLQITSRDAQNNRFILPRNRKKDEIITDIETVINTCADDINMTSKEFYDLFMKWHIKSQSRFAIYVLILLITSKYGVEGREKIKTLFKKEDETLRDTTVKATKLAITPTAEFKRLLVSSAREISFSLQDIRKTSVYKKKDESPLK